jgi:hypothetical protein
VSAHVDQLTWHGEVAFIQRSTHRLVAATNCGQSHHRDHRVEEPSPASAKKLPMRSDDHPDHQRQQGGGPHPAEHLVNPGAEPHQEKTAQSHEQRRSRRPSLWLIAEPHREQGQHRPTQRESTQECPGDLALLCRNEGGGHKK